MYRVCSGLEAVSSRMGVDLGALNEYLADKTFVEGCVRLRKG